MPKRPLSHFQVGDRVQVLWEIQEEESELVYFSATVKAEIADDLFVLAYDEVKDYAAATEAQVRLVDAQTLFALEDESTQKWRSEAPKIPAILQLTDRPDAFCPLGHVLSRDFASETVDECTCICDCCLSCYTCSNGQWQCTDDQCQDWGVCDNCLQDYLNTGGWSFCDEVQDEDQDCVYTSSEILLAPPSEDASPGNSAPLDFLQQSTLAHGYRHVVDVFKREVRALVEANGADYVIRAEDIWRISQLLNKNA